MISEAIEYPLEGDDAVKTLAIGGGIFLASGAIGFFGALLSVIPFVGWLLAPFVFLLSLVPTLLVGGYSVAVSRSVMAGSPKPPQFTDWGQYLRDGLYVALIGLVYSVPGVVLGVAGAVLFGVGTLLPQDAQGPVFVVLTVAGGLVGVAYALAFGYAFPAALVNYARTGRVNAAWDVATLRPVLTDREYGLAWVLATVVLLAANSVGSGLTWLLVGFAVFFYGQVVAVYLYTNGVADALGETVEPPAPPSSPADGAETADPTDESLDDGESADEVEPLDDDAADGETDDESEAVDVDGPAGEGDSDAAATDEDRDLVDVSGVGSSKAEALRAAGYETVSDLRSASRDELVENVTGVGPALADQIKNDVGDE